MRKTHKNRYVELIDGEPRFSSDNLNAVINSSIADYEAGESDGEDIEIYDQKADKIIWTTSED